MNLSGEEELIKYQEREVRRTWHCNHNHKAIHRQNPLTFRLQKVFFNKSNLNGPLSNHPIKSGSINFPTKAILFLN